MSETLKSPQSGLKSFIIPLAALLIDVMCSLMVANRQELNTPTSLLRSVMYFSNSREQVITVT